MISKIIASLILILCLLISLLRGVGILQGDFILPLLLLSQLIIVGYIYQLLKIVSDDVILRYNRKGKNKIDPPWYNLN